MTNRSMLIAASAPPASGRRLDRAQAAGGEALVQGGQVGRAQGRAGGEDAVELRAVGGEGGGRLRGGGGVAGADADGEGGEAAVDDREAWLRLGRFREVALAAGQGFQLPEHGGHRGGEILVAGGQPCRELREPVRDVALLLDGRVALGER